MNVNKITPLEDYLTRLKNFVEDERSKENSLLHVIPIMNSKGLSRIEELVYKYKVIDEKYFLNPDEMVSDFANNYLKLGISNGNEEIFLHGEQGLQSKVIEHLEKGNTWVGRKGNCEKSQPFISEIFGMYLQVEDWANYNSSYKNGFEKNLLLDGKPSNVRIIFPGVRGWMFNPSREGKVFYRQRNLANTIIYLSEYILENKISAHMYLSKKPFSSLEEDELIINNPSGGELSFLEEAK